MMTVLETFITLFIMFILLWVVVWYYRGEFKEEERRVKELDKLKAENPNIHFWH